MARINIEDCWWIDPRRSALARLVGSEELADGIAVKAWRTAQEFWRSDKLIPGPVFELLAHADALVRCQLAEIRDEGVYLRGSCQYLEWVKEAREKGRKGGRTSSKRHRDARGRLLPAQAEPKQTPSSDQAEAKPIQASGSGSVSGSVSDSNTKKKSGRPSDGTRLWEFYSEGIKAKNLQAVKSGKTGRFCSELVRRHGLDRAKDIVRIYLDDDSPFVADQAWQLGLLVSQEQRYLSRLTNGPPAPPGKPRELSEVEQRFLAEAEEYRRMIFRKDEYGDDPARSA